MSEKRKRGRPRKDPSSWTTARQFRLSDATLAKIDWLAARLDLETRSDVIRLAVSRLAREEGYEDNEARK